MSKLQDIQRRRAKISQPPWAWEQYGEKSNCYRIGVACNKQGEAQLGYVETDRYDEESNIFVEDILWKNDLGDNEGATVNYGDADFIAHAPTDIDWLIAENAKLRAVAEAALVVGKDLANRVQRGDVSLEGLMRELEVPLREAGILEDEP